MEDRHFTLQRGEGGVPHFKERYLDIRKAQRHASQIIFGLVNTLEGFTLPRRLHTAKDSDSCSSTQKTACPVEAVVPLSPVLLLGSTFPQSFKTPSLVGRPPVSDYGNIKSL